MSTSPIELIQFPYSHYNEKARWALDFKCLSHTRTSLMPGPHAPKVKRMTGNTTTPIIRVDGRFIDGSANIIDELERRHPDPPLYPSDPAGRKRALEIQSWFDEHIGPSVRRSLFAVLVQHPGYLAYIFSHHRSALTRILYRASMPIAVAMIGSSMKVRDADAVREGEDWTRKGLDFVVAEAGPSGYLVGDRFSVADLTAASLLSLTARPPGSPVDIPTPRPKPVDDWLERWKDHRGVSWILDMYARHRGQSAEVQAA